MKCPKHNTGGGPCYCSRPTMYRYVITDEKGQQHTEYAETMVDAIRELTSVKGHGFQIASCVRHPVIGD